VVIQSCIVSTQGRPSISAARIAIASDDILALQKIFRYRSVSR
jgi:hypothetical protein